MTSENNQPDTNSNEDLEFEKQNVSTTETQPVADNEETSTASLDESKADELAANDVPPLSDAEKVPKLDEPEENQRINEMNRRTSIGD